MFQRLILLLMLGLGLASQPAAAADRVLVFAASSLREAVDAALLRFRQQSGFEVSVSYASSGVLARQLDHGAPAQIFISANTRWADWLSGRLDIAPALPSGTVLMRNRLVLVSPDDGSAPLSLDSSLIPSLENARLAMGDAGHVPAGIYARQALENLALWRPLTGRVAFAPDVRAALALVQRKEAAAGIVYETDARVADGVRIDARFPHSSHDAIEYHALRIAGKNDQAVNALYQFLFSDDAAKLFSSYGFLTD